jgi:TolA-binding protein
MWNDRHTFRKLLGLAAACALALTPALASAKPPKKGGGAPPPAGGGMTFSPEETGQAAPPDPTPPPPAKKAAAPARKSGGAPVAQATDDKAAAGPSSKTLDRALKLYEGEDYYSATIELNKVVEGQSGDDEGNRQKAEFFMGKALFQLKYYSASLSYFDRIVQKGTAHRYYNKTLQWLASLSQYLPDSAGVLDKIGKYTRADLEQPALEPVRDQLFFLLGRFHYSKGNFKDALELFAAVPEKSEFFARAKFFEGITYVRQYQAKPAAEAFKAILRKAQENPDKSTREFEELANISLARTFYSLHQFDKAVKYFDKVPQESPDWLASLFESSWAQFQMDGDSKALGNIHTLNAPFFENEFYPESLILKAVIYFQRCNYNQAMASVAEFNETYPALKKDIDSVISKYPDNAEFYSYVLKIRSGEAGLPDRVQRAADGALSDKTLAKNLDYVAELDRELHQVEKSDPAWKSTAVAGNILQDLTLQKSLAANDAGNLARERLKRLSTEIQELVKQSIKIEYETLNAQKGVIQAELKAEQGGGGSGNKKGGEVTVDDEHEKWPFDGEYWKDELGSYRVRVVNKCSAK